jgi:hypothetical protein
MPYNNTPITPSKEATGSVSLPCMFLSLFSFSLSDFRFISVIVHTSLSLTLFLPVFLSSPSPSNLQKRYFF